MLTPFDWICAGLVTIVAAAVQGTIGFGLGVVSVPLLTLVDPSLTPVPQLMMSLPLALATAWRERSSVDRAGIGWITTGRVPGALAGAWILSRVTEGTLDLVIGLVVLTAVAATRFRWTIPLRTSTRLGVGVTAGFTGTTSGIGGPPIALLYRGAVTATARSTVAAAIGIGLVVNLTALHLADVVTTTDYRVAALLFPAVLVGFGISSRLRWKIDDGRFRGAVLAVSAAAAIALLIRSLLA